MQQVRPPLKINLGCGDHWKAGWQNLDWSPKARLVWCRKLRVFDRILPQTTRRYPLDLICHDLRKIPLPFASQLAGVIFSGYVLEYLTFEQCQSVLQDCWRILMPGGLIRLSQTNIRAVVDAYHRETTPEPSEAAVRAAQKFFERVISPEYLRFWARLFRRGCKIQLFDPPKIGFMLRSAGFVQIKFYGREQEGECPDLDAIEFGENPSAPLLHVEARKPTAS
jgi:predicted SAM-dependent methyltransferase